MLTRNTTATFIGHSECYGVNPQEVRGEIIKLIECGVCEFLCGGMGQFDKMCAGLVAELKGTYRDIHSYLVIPYLTFRVNNDRLYDSIIYPEGFEKYHFKAAIPARNRFLVDNSSYAICYVTHDWGGAARTFARAKKKGLTIINLGDRKNDIS